MIWQNYFEVTVQSPAFLGCTPHPSWSERVCTMLPTLDPSELCSSASWLWQQIYFLKSLMVRCRASMSLWALMKTWMSSAKADKVKTVEQPGRKTLSAVFILSAGETVWTDSRVSLSLRAALPDPLLYSQTPVNLMYTLNIAVQDLDRGYVTRAEPEGRQCLPQKHFPY